MIYSYPVLRGKLIVGHIELNSEIKGISLCVPEYQGRNISFPIKHSSDLKKIYIDATRKSNRQLKYLFNQYGSISSLESY